MNDKYWMSKAYEQALLAKEEGDIPVGAILVKDNQLLGLGRNSQISSADPSAHAEVLAIRQASQHLQNYRLPGTTLYVTLEPCIMCAGVLLHARVQRLVYATKEKKTGSVSVFNLLHGFPSNHKVIIEEGILQDKCRELLLDFFKTKRLSRQ